MKLNENYRAEIQETMIEQAIGSMETNEKDRVVIQLIMGGQAIRELNENDRAEMQETRIGQAIRYIPYDLSLILDLRHSIILVILMGKRRLCPICLYNLYRLYINK